MDPTIRVEGMRLINIAEEMRLTHLRAQGGAVLWVGAPLVVVCVCVCVCVLCVECVVCA